MKIELKLTKDPTVTEDRLMTRITFMANDSIMTTDLQILTDPFLG